SLNGGKRLRPFLVAESSAVFGVPREAALLVGAALECIHCYSLIHDDLPAMDNSDLRRGRPTLHKKTDDATAILAGDWLLTLAFDIVTRDEIHKDATVRLLLTRALARASGVGGMVGGQILDLAGEGRFGDREPVDVARLQQMRSEEHTSELQSLRHLVCRLLLEKKKRKTNVSVLALDIPD